MGDPEGVRGQCRGRYTPPEPQAMDQAEESQPITDTLLLPPGITRQPQLSTAHITLRTDQIIVVDTQTS